MQCIYMNQDIMLNKGKQEYVKCKKFWVGWWLVDGLVDFNFSLNNTSLV